MYFIGFRSVPNVIQNDFTENQRTELMVRGRNAVLDAKEMILKFLLEVISALVNCRTKTELIDSVLLPLLKELTEVTIRSILSYLTAY